MSENVKEIKEASFEKEVLESKIPVLVDFWAPWCGPCKAIAPVLEELATEFKDALTIAKVNVDDEPALAAKYGVRGIPYLVLIKEGEKIDQKVGQQSKTVLSTWIQSYLPKDTTDKK